jgi:hypothetical protein
LILDFFRVKDVVAVRLGKDMSQVKKCVYANNGMPFHFTSDTNPDFLYYETIDTALDAEYITSSTRSRITQCLEQYGSINILRDNAEVAEQLPRIQSRNNAPDNSVLSTVKRPGPDGIVQEI